MRTGFYTAQPNVQLDALAIIYCRNLAWEMETLRTAMQQHPTNWRKAYEILSECVGMTLYVADMFSHAESDAYTNFVYMRATDVLEGLTAWRQDVKKIAYGLTDALPTPW